MTKNSKTAAQNVTGRDADIIVKALAYAITTIDNLPFIWQEGSDRDDMLLLLTTVVTDKRCHDEIMTARRHMGLAPSLVELQDHQRHPN